MKPSENIQTTPLARWFRSFSGHDGWLLILGGSIVLLGWIIHNEPLKRVVPGLVAMNPVTALCFILSGISLLCFWQRGKIASVSAIAGRIAATLITGIAVIKLCTYLFGWQFHFDQLLFRNEIEQDGGFINQIAPNTAFNFLVSGIILWLLNSRSHRFSRTAQNLSLVLLFVSLVPLVGYTYNVNHLYSIRDYIPMAFHTAALFCLLACGTLLAQAESGAVAIFISNTPGGAVARRLLPFSFMVPFALGAVTIIGHNKSVYPVEISISIIVVGSFAIFSALIWWNAVQLNRADEKRRIAEENLQKANDELEWRVKERTASLRDVNLALQIQIAEQQRAEEKIREQARLLDEANDAILVCDMQWQTIFWNKGAERLYGWTADEMLGKKPGDSLFANALPAADFQKVLETGSWNGELQQTIRSSRPIVVESRWTLVRDSAGSPKYILIINTDVTERKQLEEQFLRAQRLESLGALASGIAHDLNNTLAPVIMGAQLLKQSTDEKQRTMMLDIIQASARRGTEMVKQIVNFARGPQHQTGPVNIDSLMKEMAKILRNTFPKSILIDYRVNGELWPVQGDITELHQVLMNLCVNARDAMPNGGRLTLAAENVEVTNQNCPRNGHPGAYIKLSVSDTGSGISPEILDRIFEPFFTTKAPTKGTGLGLSTVSNIIRHHNGFIDIESIVGKGTQFHIYLPAIPNATPAGVKTPEAPVSMGHGELVMVIDDEQAVRELAKTTLENYGYRVITAPDGLAGITCFEEHKDDIRAVVSDTDMPFVDGLLAIRAIQKSKPRVPIIVASGSKRDPDKLSSIDKTRVTLLHKPYTVEQLLVAVADGIRKTKN